jgi:hypothetical protein
VCGVGGKGDDWVGGDWVGYLGPVGGLVGCASLD